MFTFIKGSRLVYYFFQVLYQTTKVYVFYLKEKSNRVFKETPMTFYFILKLSQV